MKKINYEMIAEIAADCWLPCLLCAFMSGADKNWLYYVLCMAVLVIPIIVIICKLKQQ